LVNGFGEAKSEDRRAKVGGPKGRERGEFSGRGQPHQIGVLRERCKLPQRDPGGVWASKEFSRILKTQGDLSGQQDYGPRRIYFFCFLTEW